MRASNILSIWKGVYAAGRRIRLYYIEKINEELWAVLHFLQLYKKQQQQQQKTQTKNQKWSEIIWPKEANTLSWFPKVLRELQVGCFMLSFRSVLNVPARISSSTTHLAAPQEAGKAPLWRGDSKGRGVQGLRKTVGDAICWKTCHQLLSVGMNLTHCEVSQN